MRRTLSLGSSVLLLVVLAAGAVAQAPSPPDEAATASTIKALKVRKGETLIVLEDLHCATCAKKVTSRLFKIKGVMRVRTSVKLDAAVVTPQAKKPFDAAAGWAALQAAGYQPAQLIGPDGVFVPHEETKDPLKVAEAPAPARN